MAIQAPLLQNLQRQLEVVVIEQIDIGNLAFAFRFQRQHQARENARGLAVGRFFDQFSGFFDCTHWVVFQVGNRLGIAHKRALAYRTCPIVEGENVTQKKVSRRMHAIVIFGRVEKSELTISLLFVKITRGWVRRFMTVFLINTPCFGYRVPWHAWGGECRL